MAKNDDDALTAAQKRAMRTGRSFFPAANSLSSTPGDTRPSLPDRFPQGQTIIQAGGGYGYGGQALPINQNPAYQAALSRNPTPASRYAAAKTFIPETLGTLNGATVQTAPGGGIKRTNPNGSYSVVQGSPSDYTSRAGFVPFNPVAQASLQPSAQDPTKSVAYMSGYMGGGSGALSSVGQTMGASPAYPGGYRSQGGVQTPIENLTPSERVAGGVGSFWDTLRGSPASMAIRNASPVATNSQYASNLGSGLPNFSQIGQQLGTIGGNIANWFRPQPVQRYSDVTNPPRDYFNPTDRF